MSREKIIILDILSLIYEERMDILNYFFAIAVAINAEIRGKFAEIASYLYKICEYFLKFSYFMMILVEENENYWCGWRGTTRGLEAARVTSGV